MDMLEVANATRSPYSPIALNHEWPRMTRLLITLTCTIVGTLGNGFFVASFFVDKDLKKHGLVYMACAGACDFIVTSTVLPMATVVILSGEWDTEDTCFMMQCIMETCTYSYTIFSTMAALESLYKFCEEPKYNVKLALTLQTIFIIAVSITFGYGGVYLKLDYDYCGRRHHAQHFFQLSTFIIFTAVPFVVTVYALIRASCRIRNKIRKQSHFQRSQLERESATNIINIAAFFLCSIAWTPYLLVVHFYPNASDSRYYVMAWIGVMRCVLTSFLYGFFDKYFRRAFAHLFNYFCCKDSLSGSYASRPRNRVVYTRSPPDVRVHIMHQAVNTNSPQRAGSSGRDVLEL